MCRSPCPIVCAQATAACSTTRKNSSERSDSMFCRCPFFTGKVSVRMISAFMRRQFAPERFVLPEAQNVIRLHERVDFPRAFVDYRALAVAVDPSHRILVGIP